MDNGTCVVNYALAALLLPLLTALGAPLLDSTFDKPPDVSWVPLNGRWYYEDGAYCETTDGNIPYWSVAGETTWDHVEIAVAMKALDSGGSLFVAGRWQDAENHYELEYEGRGGAIAINRVLFGERRTLARRAKVLDIGGGKNAFGQFRFALAGPLLKVFIADACVLQTVDRTFTSGRIALGELQRRGVWDSVRVTALTAPSADDIAAQSPVLELLSRRTSFLRGEQPILRYALRNAGTKPMPRVSVLARLLGVMGTETTYDVIPAGEQVTFAFPLDTRVLRSASYALKLEVAVGDIPVHQRLTPITVAPAPNPQRMDVINWTGANEGIESHGFTATWFGPQITAAHARPALTVPLRAADPEAQRAADTAYNDMVAHGLLSGFQIHNISARHLEIPEGMKLTGVTWDGKDQSAANPHHPVFREWATAWMEAVMKSYTGFAALRYVNLNSEWGRAFDYSPETVALYKRAFSGREPPRFAYPVDRKAVAAEHLPIDGVIEDDNPYYTYLLWWWREGQGWTGFNADMARIIKSQRPDILTISEPTARIPALYGKALGCDIAQDWSYAYPSPRSILLTTDFLVATKKRTGQMISHDVQFLWKRGWVGPDDMLPSPDVIRECMWMNMSRPMDALFMWGTQIAVQDARDPRPTCNPDTYEAFKDFAETVIQPFGPLLRKTSSPHKPVAVLMSAASQLFVKGWRWGPGIHTMHLYDALQAAQVPTDLLLEEDVRDGALEQRQYRALVLSFCQTLPRSVVERVAAFARDGGVVVADQYLEADIRGVSKVQLDFTPYRSCRYATVAKGQPDADQVKKEQFRKLVTQLRDSLSTAYEEELRIDAPDVLYNQLDARGIRLFAFINDRRTFGEWAGRFRTIHDAGVAQSCRVQLRLCADEQVLYDVLAGREIAARAADGWARFVLSLPPAGGTYVAVYPERIAQVQVAAAAGAAKTDPVTVDIEIRGESGTHVPGLQPLRIDVRDAAGVPTEYSRYACAENGRFRLSFRPAVNESGGDWRVDVADLTSGKKASRHVLVPHGKARFEEVRFDAAAPFDLGKWDRD